MGLSFVYNFGICQVYTCKCYWNSSFYKMYKSSFSPMFTKPCLPYSSYATTMAQSLEWFKLGCNQVHAYYNIFRFVLCCENSHSRDTVWPLLVLLHSFVKKSYSRRFKVNYNKCSDGLSISHFCVWSPCNPLVKDCTEIFHINELTWKSKLCYDWWSFSQPVVVWSPCGAQDWIFVTVR
jgi:hypothetical protein